MVLRVIIKVNDLRVFGDSSVKDISFFLIDVVTPYFGSWNTLLVSVAVVERWSYREVEIRVNGSDKSGLSAGTKRVTFVERWSFVGYRN